MKLLEFIQVLILGVYVVETILLGGLFLFGGFAATGTDISAARTRGALTHPITKGIFLWSTASTFVSLGLKHPIAGVAFVGCGVFFALVVLLIFSPEDRLGWPYLVLCDCLHHVVSERSF
jgi:hypothetical protein